jgi:hypothetical protein
MFAIRLGEPPEPVDLPVSGYVYRKKQICSLVLSADHKAAALHIRMETPVGSEECMLQPAARPRRMDKRTPSSSPYLFIQGAADGPASRCLLKVVLNLAES